MTQSLSTIISSSQSHNSSDLKSHNSSVIVSTCIIDIVTACVKALISVDRILRLFLTTVVVTVT